MLLGHSLNIDHNLPLGDPPAESAQTGLGIKSADKIRFSILEAGLGNYEQQSVTEVTLHCHCNG